MYDTLSICPLIAEYSVPSSPVQAGIGTIMSRGNDTTVTRRGESLMCTSRVTSLRSPSVSSAMHAVESAAFAPSHESVPTISMFTPPSISPIVGGSASSSLPIDTPASLTARAASHTA